MIPFIEFCKINHNKKFELTEVQRKLLELMTQDPPPRIFILKSRYARR